MYVEKNSNYLDVANHLRLILSDKIKSWDYPYQCVVIILREDVRTWIKCLKALCLKFKDNDWEPYKKIKKERGKEKKKWEKMNK